MTTKELGLFLFGVCKLKGLNTIPCYITYNNIIINYITAHPKHGIVFTVNPKNYPKRIHHMPLSSLENKNELIDIVYKTIKNTV